MTGVQTCALPISVKTGEANLGKLTVKKKPLVNGAATITNKAVTGEDKLGKLTVTKKPLVNGPGVRSAFRGASLRGTPVKFGFTVTGPNNYSQTFELAPGESKELKNLYFGGYTVTETNAHGYTATYSVTDGKVTLKAEDKEKTVEVTNTSGGPGTVVEKTIKKVWVNGGKPDTVIELWRKGTAANGSAIDEKVGEFTANATKTEETFSNLAKHDPKGNEFEYYAKEPNVPGNYTDTYSADKLTVTNTYSQPQTADDIKATKTWSGQGSATPEISFTLYRKAGANGTEEQVTGTPTHPNPQVVPAGNEVNFGKHEKTDINGVAYIYYVKESFTNVEEKDNWTITGEDGLAVTNTLKSGSDTKAKLTIEKVLVNEAPVRTALRRAPSGIRGPLEFKFKVTGPNGYSNVNVVVKAGESVTLDNLLYGKYKVEEIEAHGFTPSYAPGQEVTLKSDDKEKAITVTNTNGGGDALNVKKTVKKVWENGDKPATVIELWRKNNVTGADKIDEKVNEFTTTAGQDSEKEFTKTSGGKLLAKYDSKGNEFEYYAKEPNVPENYDKTENGLTVTNKYKQPQTDEDVKAKKTWTDADNYNPKPEIKFELWRKNGTAGAGEKVVDATALTNNEVNFGKQLKTDINGVEYTYFVKEIFTNAEEKDNWTITGDGSALAVDNKLKSGTDTKAKLTVKKVLINEVPTRTALYRAPLRIRGPLEFKFKVTGPGGFSKEFKLKAGEEKVFDNLFFGKYKVEEIETNGFTPGYAPGQEVTLKSDDKEKTVTVTNTNGGGDTLNVKKTVKKVWVNGDKPATVIELWRKNNVTGADKIDEKVNEFTTTAGQDSEKEFDKTANGIDLAKYDPSGREFEYYAKEPNVPENYHESYSDDKLTVTNKFEIPQTENDVEALKIWAPENPAHVTKPGIKFELWRKGGEAGPIGQKVDGVEAKAPGSDNKVNFGKQEKTDINGVVYEYFVKEIFDNPDDPTVGNWEKTENGLNVTNKVKSGEETLGKLVITKKVVVKDQNGIVLKPDSNEKFKFRVTGEYGYESEFELGAGESKEIKNLYFGKYVVTEKDSKGYYTAYSKKNGEVEIRQSNKKESLDVINSKVVVDPPVEKEVIGNPENNDKFRFEFKSISNTAGIDNMPMPKAAGNAKSMTATITGSGSTEFGTFELTKAGTYIYEISEINDGIQGYKYDTSKYEVKYVVTKDENGLHAKTYITKNGKEEKSAKFVNTYKAKPPVKKKVVKKVNKKTVAETGDPIDVNMFAIMGMASILVILLMIVIAVGERRRQKE